MTRPVHTIKYMQSQYRKYQIAAIICALLAITAALISAFSSIQVSSLRKEQIQADKAKISQNERLENQTQKRLDAASKQLTEALVQLDNEKKQSRSLQEKISSLENQIQTLQIKIRQSTAVTATPSPVVDAQPSIDAQQPAPALPDTQNSAPQPKPTIEQPVLPQIPPQPQQEQNQTESITPTTTSEPAQQ